MRVNPDLKISAENKFFALCYGLNHKSVVKYFFKMDLHFYQ